MICSASLAKVIFEVAFQNGFGNGYAWFVTEDVMRGALRGKMSTRSSRTTWSTSSRSHHAVSASFVKGDYSSYPEGLLAVVASKGLEPATLMSDVIRLIAEGLRRYSASRRESTGVESLSARAAFSGNGCFDSRGRYFPDGDHFYRLAIIFLLLLKPFSMQPILTTKQRTRSRTSVTCTSVTCVGSRPT